MKKFEKLSRNEMKQVLGGNMPIDSCSAAVVCSDGSLAHSLTTYADCSDESGGSAMDQLCGDLYGSGSISIECDCSVS